MRKIRSLLLLSLVPLAGCAGPAGLLVNQDLAQATSMAQAAGDAQAVGCYQALAKADTGSIVGVFGANEQLRILHMARVPCAQVLTIAP